MMKKLFPVIAVLLIIGFVGCDSGNVTISGGGTKVTYGEIPDAYYEQLREAILEEFGHIGISTYYSSQEANYPENWTASGTIEVWCVVLETFPIYQDGTVNPDVREKYLPVVVYRRGDLWTADGAGFDPEKTYALLGCAYETGLFDEIWTDEEIQDLMP